MVRAPKGVELGPYDDVVEALRAHKRSPFPPGAEVVLVATGKALARFPKRGK